MRWRAALLLCVAVGAGCGGDAEPPPTPFERADRAIGGDPAVGGLQADDAPGAGGGVSILVTLQGGASGGDRERICGKLTREFARPLVSFSKSGSATQSGCTDDDPEAPPAADVAGTPDVRRCVEFWNATADTVPPQRPSAPAEYLAALRRQAPVPILVTAELDCTVIAPFHSGSRGYVFTALDGTRPYDVPGRIDLRQFGGRDKVRFNADARSDGTLLPRPPPQ